MLRSSRKLPTTLFTLPRFRYRFTAVKASPFKFAKSSIWSKLALGCGLMLSFGYVHMIEDETIRNLKNIMARQVNLLKG